MPLVDIALPVYNGERFLEPAIRSILDQDFKDFRLLISDNASTDHTQEICQSFASDSRVEYFCQSNNIGAAPNFNYLFEQSDARYFKWAAADDLLAPNFIGSCVEALEASRKCVLAFSNVQVIGVDGEEFEVDDPSLRLSSKKRTDRFRELTRFHRYPCYEIFGLFRRAALCNTDLIAGYSGGDRNLLAHVCLRGEVAIDSRLLFLARRHPNQSVSMVKDKLKYDVWFHPSNSGRVRLPEWQRFRGYNRTLVNESLSVAESALCYAYLVRQMGVRWRQLASDIKNLPQSLRT